MSPQNLPMTPEGYQKLVDELKHSLAQDNDDYIFAVTENRIAPQLTVVMSTTAQ